jgi:hypothetical protein
MLNSSRVNKSILLDFFLELKHLQCEVIKLFNVKLMD